MRHLAGGLALVFWLGCGAAEVEMESVQPNAAPSSLLILKYRPTATPLHEKFDASDLRVPLTELATVKDPDPFPVLVDPRTVPAKDATFMQSEDWVVGVNLQGTTRAYPLKVLFWHEVVNDHLRCTPLLITYCEICQSALAFDRRLAGETLEFGIAGILHHNNLVLYERRSGEGGLWTQIRGQSISGRYAGQNLVSVPTEVTTWCDWLTRHPDSTVLSTDSGHVRDYDEKFVTNSPYPTSMGPRVLGIWFGDRARAYVVCRERERRVVTEDIDGRAYTLEFDPQANSVRVLEADSELQWGYARWSAWEAFHPESELVGCNDAG